MKPSRISFREMLRARAKLVKDEVTEHGKLYHAAIALSKDPEAAAFYSANCEGKTTKQALEEVMKARLHNSLSETSAANLERVISQAGPFAGGGDL